MHTDTGERQELDDADKGYTFTSMYSKGLEGREAKLAATAAAINSIETQLH